MLADKHMNCGILLLLTNQNSLFKQIESFDLTSTHKSQNVKMFSLHDIFALYCKQV